MSKSLCIYMSIHSLERDVDCERIFRLLFFLPDIYLTVCMDFFWYVIEEVVNRVSESSSG